MKSPWIRLIEEFADVLPAFSALVLDDINPLVDDLPFEIHSFMIILNAEIIDHVLSFLDIILEHNEIFQMLELILVNIIFKIHIRCRVDLETVG